MLMRAPLIRLVIALGAGRRAAPGCRRAATAATRRSSPARDHRRCAQDPQRPTFRPGINFVRVDVIVSDKNGNPILDLKPEEFSVSEDGKAQKIEQFSSSRSIRSTRSKARPTARSARSRTRSARRPGPKSGCS